MNYARIFQPETIAVIGVSLNNDQHPANVIYNKIHLRYPVKVYPVNPRGGQLKRDRVYASVADIPTTVDLAVIAVRAEYIPNIISDCIETGVGGATIISGGFAEIGRIELQQRIVELARKADFPFIGPNCLGSIHPANLIPFFFLVSG